MLLETKQKVFDRISKTRELKEMSLRVEQNSKPEKNRRIGAAKKTSKTNTDFQNFEIGKGLLGQQNLLDNKYRVLQIFVNRSYTDFVPPLLHETKGHGGEKKSGKKNGY